MAYISKDGCITIHKIKIKITIELQVGYRQQAKNPNLSLTYALSTNLCTFPLAIPIQFQTAPRMKQISQNLMDI